MPPPRQVKRDAAGSAAEVEDRALAGLGESLPEGEVGLVGAALATWERHAEAAEGPILDLGCGTGRVALHLARRGHRVVGLDRDPDFVAAFNGRAAGLPAEAVAADAREFDLDQRFGLVLAPMQIVQLLGGPEERIRCLGCVARHLHPGRPRRPRDRRGPRPGSGRGPAAASRRP